MSDLNAPTQERQPDNSLSEVPSALLTPEIQIDRLLHGDPGEKYYAAWWLGRMRIREGSSALIAALFDDSDRTEQGGYPIRRNAARALAKLGDPAAIPPLVQCLDSDDGQLCGAAAQAIAEIAQAGVMDTTSAEQALVDWLSSTTASTSEAALEGVIEALGSLEIQAAASLLQRFLNHGSIRVCCASLRALYQLTQDPSYAEVLMDYVHHENIHLRRGAVLDVGASGYWPGSQVIATAQVEVNIKLLALKTLVDCHLRGDPPMDPHLRQVLALIDDLI